MGSRRKGHEFKCDWCAVNFRCTRITAQYCSGRCRLRMHRFIRQFGYRPQTMPGPITADAAAALEIMRLICAEQQRIESRDKWIFSSTTPTVARRAT